MERNCPHCSSAVSERAKFCHSCGSKIEAKPETFCEECGAKNPADHIFCEECGARLVTATSTTPAAESVSTADAWGDTLLSLAAAEEEAKFTAFEYEKRPDGSVIITGLKDKYAVSLNIPEGVTVIADGAFAGSNILSVILPDGLATIDRHAFYNCPNLTEINIPPSVLMIGDEAFAECDRLTVDIPQTVRIVGADAIRGTETMRQITLANQEEQRRLAEEARQRREEQKARRRAEQRAAEERNKARREEAAARLAAEKKAAEERAAKEKKEAEERARAEAEERARAEAAALAEAEAQKLNNPTTWEANLKRAGNPYDITDPKLYGYCSIEASIWLNDIRIRCDYTSRRYALAGVVLAKIYYFGSFGYVDKETGMSCLKNCHCSDQNLTRGFAWLYKKMKSGEL